MKLPPTQLLWLLHTPQIMKHVSSPGCAMMHDRGVDEKYLSLATVHSAQTLK